MPSLSWRPSPLGMPRSVAHRRSKAAPTSSRSFSLEHHVVQRLGQLERRLGQRDGVVARVAVEEPHLELDAGASSISSQSDCWKPSPSTGTDRLVERGGGEHDVTEADAVGEEAAGHERSTNGRRRLGEPEDELDLRTPRRGGAQAVDAAGRGVGASASASSAPRVARRQSSKAAASTASKPTATASLAGPATTITPAGPGRRRAT